MKNIDIITKNIKKVKENETKSSFLDKFGCLPRGSLTMIYAGAYTGKSSLMIFDRFANLKYKYGNRHFWCRGYYVDTVGRNRKVIEEYIRTQLQEDVANDQISMKEFYDPFTGEKYFNGRK